jgi:hypothetical protein
VDIVLDTNIIVADFGLRGTAFRVAFDGIRRTDCKLLVPEVVIHEAVAKWREALTEAVEQQREAGELNSAADPREPCGTNGRP